MVFGVRLEFGKPKDTGLHELHSPFLQILLSFSRKWSPRGQSH